MNMLKIATDETLQETVRHGSSRYPFSYYLEDIWQFDFHRMDWHWHHELEFVCVTEGTALCLVGMDRLEVPAGCGLFVNSGVLHRFEAESSTVIPNIVFSPALLASENSLLYEKYVYPILSLAPPCQVFDPQIPWQNRILCLLTEIFNLQENTAHNQELHTVRLLMEIWDILFENLERTKDTQKPGRFDHRQARLQTMMQYIHDHYQEELTLEEIASSASISKSSALNLFQSYIHTPPVAYLIQYRLKQAAELLCKTEKPVSAIAQETGFTDTGYFCRKFRQRYRMTPGQYRRR